MKGNNNNSYGHFHGTWIRVLSLVLAISVILGMSDLFVYTSSAEDGSNDVAVEKNIDNDNVPVTEENESDVQQNDKVVSEESDNKQVKTEAKIEEESSEKEMEKNTISSKKTSDGTVVKVSGTLPENAKVKVKPVTLTEEEINEYFGDTEVPGIYEMEAYDIKIMDGTKEWQPEQPVEVEVSQKELVSSEDIEFKAKHIDSKTDEASDVDAEVDKKGNITLKADGFSTYIFYTVDFHHEDMEFSISGGSEVLLSDLFNALGIDKDVSDVTGVDFTNEELVKVEKVAGDYKLTSIKKFKSEEMLTVYMENGFIKIPVTDAVIIASGNGWTLDDNGLLTISGEVDSWSSTTTAPWYANRTKIKSVVATEGAKVPTCIGMFNGCTELTSVDLSKLNTEDVTNIQYLFNGCNALSDINLSGVDFSAVTSSSNADTNLGTKATELKINLSGAKIGGAKALISGAANLTELNLNNAALPVDASGMCKGLAKLKKVELDGTNAAATTSMKEMFSGCTKLTSLDLSKVTNASKVTSIASLANGCTALTSAKISGMDTSGVTDVSYIFNGTTALTNVDIAGCDLSKAAIVGSAFATAGTKAESLKVDATGTSIPKNLFKGYTGITEVDLTNAIMPETCSSMFEGDTKLQKVTMNGTDFAATTTMANMFKNCSALPSVDLSKIKNTSGVQTIANMFNGAAAMQNVNINGCDFSGVTNTDTAFGTCGSGVAAGTKVTVVGTTIAPGMFKSAANLSEVDLSNVLMPANCSSMFTGDTKLAVVTMTEADFSNATTMASMFNGCTALKSVDMSGANASNVTSMNSMFKACSNLETINMSNMNTESVTDITGLVDNCTSLKLLNLSGDNLSLAKNSSKFSTAGSADGFKVDLSNANISSVTNLFQSNANLTEIDLSGTVMPVSCANMFYGCSKLASVKLDGVDFGNTTTMLYMFRDCDALTSIDLHDMSFPKATTMQGMMYSCDNLESVNFNGIAIPKVTTINGLFRYCTKMKSVQMDNVDFSAVNVIGADSTPQTVFINMGDGDCSVSMKNSKFTAPKLFYNADGISSIDLTGTTLPSSCDNLFYSSEKLKSINIKNADFSNTKTMAGMLKNCTALESLDLSGAETSNVTSINGMCSGCSALKTVDMHDMDTSAIKDVSSFLANTTALTKLDMRNVDFTAVTTVGAALYSAGSADGWTADLSGANIGGFVHMFFNGEGTGNTRLKSVNLTNTIMPANSSYMFSGNTALESVDVTNADFSNVTTTARMFQNCSSLKNIDLTDKDMSKVTTMQLMFYNCTGLETADLSGCNAPLNKSIDRMFLNCSSLKEVDMSDMDLSAVNATYSEANNIFTNAGAADGFDVTFKNSKLGKIQRLFRNNLNIRNVDFTNTVLNDSAESLLYGAKNLESVDFTGADTTGVTTWATAFQDIGLNNGDVAFTVSEGFYQKGVTVDSKFTANWTWVADNGLIANNFKELNLVKGNEGTTYHPSVRAYADANGGIFKDGSSNYYFYTPFNTTVLDKLPEVKREGYTFLGWAKKNKIEKEEDGSRKLIDGSTIIEKNDANISANNKTYELIAQWVEDPAVHEKVDMIKLTITGSGSTIPNTHFRFPVTAEQSEGLIFDDDYKTDYLAVVKMKNKDVPVDVTFTEPGTYTFDMTAPRVEGFINTGATNGKATVTVIEDPDNPGKLIISKVVPAEFSYSYVGKTSIDGDVLDEFDLEDAKKTDDLTAEDKNDEEQYNYQYDANDQGSIVKTAKWTDKHDGDAEIQIVAQSHDMGEATAVYIFTNCNAHGLNGDIATKNIEFLMQSYSKVDVICVNMTSATSDTSYAQHLEQTFYNKDDVGDKNGNIASFMEKIAWSAPRHTGAMLEYAYLDDYLSKHNPSAIYINFDGTRGFDGNVDFTMNDNTNQKLAAYQNAGRYFVMETTDSGYNGFKGQAFAKDSYYYLFMMLVNPAWTVMQDPADFTKDNFTVKTGKYYEFYTDYSIYMPDVYKGYAGDERSKRIVDYKQSFDEIPFLEVLDRSEVITDIVNPKLSFTESDVKVRTMDGEDLVYGEDYTVELKNTESGTQVIVKITDGILTQAGIVTIDAKADQFGNDDFLNTNMGDATASIETTYTDGTVVDTDLKIDSPKLFRYNYLDYEVIGDEIYGIPEDSVTPESTESAVGEHVTLENQPTTSWRTSDGTDSGVRGKWVFYPNATNTKEAGWNYNTDQTADPLTGTAVTALDMPDNNVTVYGKWVFKAKRDEDILEVTKVDAGDSSKKLDKAQFILYSDEDCTTIAKAYIDVERTVELTENNAPFTSSRDEDFGTLKFYGMDEDEIYYLAEKTAPDGYNLLAKPIKVMFDEDAETWKYVNYNIFPAVEAVADFDDETGLFKITVSNKTGIALPDTGGMGTKLLMMIGLLAIVLACAYAIHARRREA